MEHDWEDPSMHPVDGSRSNIWKCKRCKAVIVWNGWPGSPIDDPHYFIAPPPQGPNRFTSYLGNQDRDCDLEIVRRIHEEPTLTPLKRGLAKTTIA